MFKKLFTLVLAATFFATPAMWALQGNAAYGADQAQEQDPATGAKDPHAGHQHDVPKQQGPKKTNSQEPAEQQPDAPKTDAGKHDSHLHDDQKKQ